MVTLSKREQREEEDAGETYLRAQGIETYRILIKKPELSTREDFCARFSLLYRCVML
jgi:hypothetical protein